MEGANFDQYQLKFRYTFTETPPISRSSSSTNLLPRAEAQQEETTQSNRFIAPSLSFADEIRRHLFCNAIELEEKPLTEEEKKLKREATLVDVLQKLNRLDRNDLTLNNIEELSNQFTKFHGFTRKHAKDFGVEKLKYLDIIPYDHTLAIQPKYERADFVNENYITIGGKTYIASEGPRPEDFYNFWLMALENSNVIVMLTELVEGSRIKAHCYWPVDKQTPETYRSLSGRADFDPIVVSLTNTEYFTGEAQTNQEDQHFNLDEYLAAKRQFIVKYSFVVKKGDHCKEIVLYHYRFLQDMSAPQTEEQKQCFLLLLKKIKEAEAHYRDLNTEQKNTTIVHCSAGVGRTGLILGCLFKGEEIANGAIINAPRLAAAQITLRMRAQRTHLVQTPCQLNLIEWYIDHLVNPAYDVKNPQ